MMKRFFLVAALVASIIALQTSLPRILSAEGALQSAVRIGYVDFNRALNTVSDGVAAKKRLREEFKERQQQLDRLQEDLSRIRSELDSQKSSLSPSDMKSREDDYRKKFFELQQMLAAFRREMEIREANLTKDILKKLRTVVQDIGNEEGYSLILEKSQDVVLFAPQGSDLTDRVIAGYDRGKGKRR